MFHTHPSSQKTALFAGALLVAAPGWSQAAFTARDAIRAEWARKPPVLSPEARQALPQADRERLDLTLKRIGAPGAPALLPPWLAEPRLEDWEARTANARMPEERFTALHFLNRLKSPKALAALDGLKAEDALIWPRHLHLELPIATARVNGAVPSADLQAFLQGLLKAGKIDPVRDAAARFRLVVAGRMKGDPVLPDSPNLAYLDAWNRGPWSMRSQEHLRLLTTSLAAGGNPGPVQRLLEGLPEQPIPEAADLALKALASGNLLVRLAALDYFGRVTALDAKILDPIRTNAFRTYGGPECGAYLAVLRRHAPADADRYDKVLLGQEDLQALAAAIEDLPQPPAHLEALVKRLWHTSHYDAVQPLLPALERWKLPEPERKALLKRFLDHPCWTARLDAYTLLAKLDPATPWPPAPAPSFLEQAILDEAERLAASTKPVRLRIQFDGMRSVVIRLDPATAPINVANLVLLARRGFFDGRSVPRVVPDFVVQMGSPLDTMDGGPGYTVRCEDSLAWFGPGSVGMALSGKDTGGSQFFITTNATPHLTGRYTRVGEVEDPDHALPMLDGLELGTRILKVEVF